jgi:putative peptidoglycan lipid II flippase
VNAVIDTFFASRFIDPTLAPTAIQKAFLVYMLPQGVFSVAIATVLFPTLSRLSARGDLAGFRATISSGLRQLAFLLIPASAVTAVLAEPIVVLDEATALAAQVNAGTTTVAAITATYFQAMLPYTETAMGLDALMQGGVPTAGASGTRPRRY